MYCRLTKTTEYDLLRLIEIFISQEQWKVNEIQKKNSVGRGTEVCEPFLTLKNGSKKSMILLKTGKANTCVRIRWN
jgi:hypothetical protein